jgi:xylulokinase
MTGEFASDMSDAAGTMWMDVAKRDWSDEMLAACGLTRDNMPALFEGCDITGHLLASVASAWKIPAVLVVAGGGDNAAGALVSEWRMPGRQCCRWAISGVYFAVEGFLINRKARCTASATLPGRWHLMSVMLSAASCLDWAAKLTGLGTVPALIDAAQTADVSAGPVWFCRIFPVSARRTTTPRLKACSSVSRISMAQPNWRVRCWKALASR